MPTNNRHLRNSAVKGRHVAILILGEAFRSGLGGGNDRPCNMSRYSLNGQRDASASIVQNLIKPLEAAGANVSLLFTVPQVCSDTQVRTLVQWLGVCGNRVVHHRVSSLDGCEGWTHGYRLLQKHRQHAPVDFVMQTRHDIHIDTAWSDWPLSGFSYPQEQPWGQGRWKNESHPPRVSWESVLFEQECRSCNNKANDGNSCGCSLLPMWDYARWGARGAAAERWRRDHGPGGKFFIEWLGWPLQCSICHRDHLLWVPHHWLDTVISAVVDDGACLHNALDSFEARGVPRREMGFLFPAQCADPCWVPYGADSSGEGCDTEKMKSLVPRNDSVFHSALMCDETDAYRPARQHA